VIPARLRLAVALPSGRGRDVIIAAFAYSLAAPSAMSRSMRATEPSVPLRCQIAASSQICDGEGRVRLTAVSAPVVPEREVSTSQIMARTPNAIRRGMRETSLVSTMASVCHPILSECQ
jgi:hypothetical protein